MKKLMVFNWKMNPGSYGEAEKIFKAALELSGKAKKAEIVICPPFIWLESFSKLLKAKSPALLAGRHKPKAELGAQDVFWEESGAYTGEISPLMLKHAKVDDVIIGHSERRKYLKETDETINKKVLTALKSGLKVILCVGENLKIRRRGKKSVMAFVKNQLEKDLKNVSSFKLQASSLIIAYEPIWAIGTGKPCNPEDALEVIKFIKNFLISHFSLLNTKVLYGGSINGKNIESFLKYKQIDGALVGGASLEPKQFKTVLADKRR